jgi:hypothetical protein
MSRKGFSALLGAETVKVSPMFEGCLGVSINLHTTNEVELARNISESLS